MNRTGSNVLASTINVTVKNSIIKVWYDHYYRLLNSNGNTSNQPYVEPNMNDIIHFQIINFKWVKEQVLIRCKMSTLSMHTLRLLLCYQFCLIPCFYTTIYLVRLWRLLLFLL